MTTTHATSQPSSPREGKYLYAILADDRDRAYDVVGIDGRPVYGITNGRVGAVVSDCSRERIRPERCHLAAHKDVLRRLMLDRTVLPMAFGIVASDLRAVQRMLRVNQETFVEQLDRVAGRVEMGLRVVWDVDNIFEYFVDHHPDLRAARDRLLGGNRVARQEEKLELGRFFEQVLTEDRDNHFNEIEAALTPCCDAIKRSPPRQVQEVVNLSLLVEREKLKELDEAVLVAAQSFDNNFSFEVSGPWAPHNFVEMSLQLDLSNGDERHAHP